MTIEGSKTVTMPMRAAEARALEVAADQLEGVRKLPSDRRKVVGGRLKRLVARYQLKASVE
jgi:hypothetical protein